MKSRLDEVMDRRKRGYNCTQAVICSYCDLKGIPEDLAFRISEGFGRGMGGIREGACGALIGAIMLLGLETSSGSVENGLTKRHTYSQAAKMSGDFRDLTGSIRCIDLLGLGEPGKRYPCNNCIMDAARLVEQMLGGFDEPAPAAADEQDIVEEIPEA